MGIQKVKKFRELLSDCVWKGRYTYILKTDHAVVDPYNKIGEFGIFPVFNIAAEVSTRLSRSKRMMN